MATLLSCIGVSVLCTYVHTVSLTLALPLSVCFPIHLAHSRCTMYIRAMRPLRRRSHCFPVTCLLRSVLVVRFFCCVCLEPVQGLPQKKVNRQSSENSTTYKYFVFFFLCELLKKRKVLDLCWIKIGFITCVFKVRQVCSCALRIAGNFQNLRLLPYMQTHTHTHTSVHMYAHTYKCMYALSKVCTLAYFVCAATS